MAKTLACFLLLLSILALADAPRAAAENLPVTVDRYAQACTKTGGGMTRGLNGSGTGVVYCAWEIHGRTECKVGSNQVNICTIRCRSDTCYAANQYKDRPIWPLSGGPKKNVAPMDTLAPDTLAPVN